MAKTQNGHRVLAILSAVGLISVLYLLLQKMIGSYVFRLLHVTLRVLGKLYNPLIEWIFSKIYEGDVKTVPPVEGEVLLQTATQLARKIRTREVL